MIGIARVNAQQEFQVAHRLTEKAIEATTEWFLAHEKYHEASDAYNQRLALVRSERERGNWSMNCDAEYRALTDAQSAALAADETLYGALHCELTHNRRISKCLKRPTNYAR